MNCPAAPVYMRAGARHFGNVKSFLIQLALTIRFLPFINAYITWVAYEYQILVHSPSLPVSSQGMTGVHTPHWQGLLLSKCGIWTNWQMFPTESLQPESTIGAHLLLCAGPPPRLSSSYTRRGSATHPCLTSAQHPLLSHINQLPLHSAFTTHWAKLMLRDSPGRA